MREHLSLRVLGLTFLTLLAIAFASGSYARSAPAASEQKLEMLQLMGMSVDDLCDEDGRQHAHLAECSLCHLVAGTNLPDAGLTLIELDRRIVAALVLPQMDRAAARPRDPATPPRGPPLPV
ncbi:hypothetical protein QCN27_11055 [Cereibacter sp. SYSU M97828]|nr:hypothetical protein [Cereibacter flavus]